LSNDFIVINDDPEKVAMRFYVRWRKRGRELTSRETEREIEREAEHLWRWR
jgi:hypothetical protein